MTGQYRWMKLDRDFFSQEDMLLLRQFRGGADAVIIYLKIILAAMNFGGMADMEAGDKKLYRRLAARLGETEEDTREAVETLLEIKRLAVVNGELIVTDMGKYVGASPRKSSWREYGGTPCTGREYSRMADMEL